MSLPDGLSFEDATPFCCAGLTTYAGLLNGGIAPGKRAAIVGIGGLGHLAIPIAKALGAEVIAVTSSADKHDLARELGADHVVTGGEGAGEAIAALGGADVVLNTATSMAPLAHLHAGLRPLSRIVLAGNGPEPAPIPARALGRRQAAILGSFIGSRQQLADLFDLALTAGIRPIIERYAMSEVDAIHDRLRANDVRFRAVMTP